MRGEAEIGARLSARCHRRDVGRRADATARSAPSTTRNCGWPRPGRSTRRATWWRRSITRPAPAAIFENNPLERRMRDIHAGTQQGQGRPIHFETVGQMLMGLPPEGRMFQLYAGSRETARRPGSRYRAKLSSSQRLRQRVREARAKRRDPARNRRDRDNADRRDKTERQRRQQRLMRQPGERHNRSCRRSRSARRCRPRSRPRLRIGWPCRVSAIVASEPPLIPISDEPSPMTKP